MTLEIRKPDYFDVHRIYDLVNSESDALIPVTAEEMYAGILGANHRIPIVAYKDGEFAGFSSVRADDMLQLAETEVPEIRSLAVVPKYRRNGVGDQLVMASVYIAREAGYTGVFSRIRLNGTSLEEMPAFKTFANNGFREYRNDGAKVTMVRMF